MREYKKPSEVKIVRAKYSIKGTSRFSSSFTAKKKIGQNNRSEISIIKFENLIVSTNKV